MSDGPDCRSDHPGKPQDGVNEYHDTHDEEIQMVARPFLWSGREGRGEGGMKIEGGGRERGGVKIEGGGREREGGWRSLLRYRGNSAG